MKKLRDQFVTWYYRQQFLNRGKWLVTNTIVRRFLRQIITTSNDGILFEVDPRDIIQLSILTTGVWEPVETHVLKRNLQVGQVFYDIGANCGYFSLLASQLVGESGHVYAFEPNPQILEKITRNIVLNGIHNITVIPFAVSDHVGEEVFYPGEATNSGLSSFRDLKTAIPVIKINTICLDEFVKENHFRPPDFIKMDVEGAEYLALLGMASILSRTNRIKLLMEVSDHFLKQVTGDETSLLTLVKNYGFRIINETSRHCRIIENEKPLQYTLFLEKQS